MDPWVKTQIRLAERQGLLTGTELSPVQVKAVFLNELLALIVSSQRSERELREALLSTGRFEFTDLFPEYAPKEDSAEAIERDLTSEEPITYVFQAPGDPGFDPEEAQRLLDSLLHDSTSGSVSAAELEWGGEDAT
jgi:hypothetical protein